MFKTKKKLERIEKKYRDVAEKLNAIIEHMETKGYYLVKGESVLGEYCYYRVVKAVEEEEDK